VVKALLVLAAIVGVIACFSAWAERQALNTDEWVNTSGKLLENDQIQKALATYAVDQLYANVDVSAQLHKSLPPNFKPISGPAASGLRSLAVTGAEKVIATSRFQQAWKQTNRTAHQTLIAIIENKGDVVSTANGEVDLKLRPLIIQVSDQLGLGGNIADKLPPDAGNLKILKSDQLGLAQTIAKLIRGLALVTTLLTLALLALAIYLSRGYRWMTVLGAGIVLIAVGIVVLILRDVAGNVLVKQLATDTAKPAADATWSIGTSLLVSIAHEVIIYGVFFIIAAWLASPHPSSVGARRALTPVLRDYPVAVMSVLGLFGVIWLLDAVGSTRAVFLRLGLIALAGVGVYQLRRRSIAEFPDATMGDLPERLRTRMREMRAKREHRGAGQPPEPQDRKLERLERLATLHDRGALNDAEFEAEKAALLRGAGSAS
jgi:Short C-terminal domain